jgi:2-hydroxy-3-oxopropionate reductase
MRLAFVGLGAMGLPMATRLSQVDDIELTLFDLDPQRLAMAEALGRRADSFADAVADADVVFTVLPADPHVAAAVNEMVQHGRTGQLFVDFTTIGPQTIVDAATRLAAHGIDTVSVALTRSTAAAASGELALFAGGLSVAHGRLQAAFDAMATEVRDVGGIDTAKAVKLANNMIVASLDVAICEAIVFGAALGHSSAEVVSALKDTDADSWPLRYHIERYAVPEDLGPGRFSTRYMAKDVALYSRMAHANGMPAQLAGIVTAQYRGTSAHGLGDSYHMSVMYWQQHAAALDRRAGGDDAGPAADELRLLVDGVAALQVLVTEEALASLAPTGLSRWDAADHLVTGASQNYHLERVATERLDSPSSAFYAEVVAALERVCREADRHDMPALLFESAHRVAIGAAAQ